MADYKDLYFKLFNKVTDVIVELQEIQKQAEELYLEDCETLSKSRLVEIKPDKGKEEKNK